jgi:hypothetical protein
VVPVAEVRPSVVSRTVGAPALAMLLAWLRGRRRRQRGGGDGRDEPQREDDARARHAVRVDPVAVEVDPVAGAPADRGAVEGALQFVRAFGGGASAPRTALSSLHVSTSVMRRFGHNNVRRREGDVSGTTSGWRRITAHPKLDTTRA